MRSTTELQKRYTLGRFSRGETQSGGILLAFLPYVNHNFANFAKNLKKMTEFRWNLTKINKNPGEN